MSALHAINRTGSSQQLDELSKLLQEGKAIRQDIGREGRLHIDRPLPFICLHLINGTKDLAARDVAAANASYLIASDIDEAIPILSLVGAEMKTRFGTFMVLDMGELEQDVLLADDSPFLPHYAVKVSSTEPETEKAKQVFVKAVSDADIRFRTPHITAPEPEDDPVLKLRAAGLQFPCISVRFAPIYRQPESGADYPGLRETMIADLFDAGLRAFAAFSTGAETLKVTSHRALGRKAFVDAVRRADRSIDDIAASFDFLLSVTPINARKAFADFKASGFQHAPHFLYRPLSVDVEEQKRKLYSVAFDHLEDPVLYHLYREKQQEIDLQLSMLAHLHKRQFMDFSRALYGSVEPPLLTLAETVLANCPRPDHSGELAMVDCYEVTRKAREMVDAYHTEDATFDAVVDIRDDLPPGLMVSGSKLLVSRHTVMEKRRLNALLHHEIGVHLLTYFNGSAQGLRLFRTGLSGYEGVQEGLAVLAEHLSGGMTRERLRLIAGRVVGCAAMLDGADFVQTYRIMTQDHGFDDAAAFNMVLRIYRGGGLSKDAIYLRGLNEILEHLRKGGSLDPFWMGKISAAHFPIMQELALRGLLRPPAIQPAFLAPAKASERLETIRSGLSIAEMANL